MKKVLITGGLGFIGSALAYRLMYDGLDITVYDDCSTGKLDNLSYWFNNPRFNCVVADIMELSTLKSAMRGCDCVWHLAGHALTVQKEGVYNEELETNLIGTWNVLEAMRETGVKQILYASSSAVYGDEPGESLPETFGPLRPTSCYGASKLAAEGFVSAYAHLFGIQAWIFRFANVVGGGMTRGITHDFIRKLRQDPKKLQLWNDGFGQKAYFLVEDCIEGMLCAYRTHREWEPDSLCGIYNLGNTTLTSVQRIAQIVIEEMGLGFVEILHGDSRYGFKGDVPTINLDVDTMLLRGWKPSCDSETAIRIAAQRLIKGIR
jgi:UDP-glucose 4-epimerase